MRGLAHVLCLRGPRYSLDVVTKHPVFWLKMQALRTEEMLVFDMNVVSRALPILKGYASLLYGFVYATPLCVDIGRYELQYAVAGRGETSDEAEWYSVDGHQKDTWDITVRVDGFDRYDTARLTLANCTDGSRVPPPPPPSPAPKSRPLISVSVP